MYLLDTHVWAWSLIQPRLLSPPVLAIVTSGLPLMLSPVSFYEVALKVRLGKWPEMAEFAEAGPSLFAEQGGLSVPVTDDIAITAGACDWPHRDPFDRLISATALCHTLILISADPAFDSHPDRRLRRFWLG